MVMYNSEVKERFFDEYSSRGPSTKYIRGRLEEISDYESLLSKDLAEMSRVEAVNAINSLEFFELGSAEAVLSSIKLYVKWCIDSAIFSNPAGGFLDVSLNDIDPSRAMSKMFFRDEGDFLYSLRKVREFDELQNDVIALIFAWLGVSISDALNICDDGVDFDSRKIYDRTGTVVVEWFSDEIAEVLLQYQRSGSAVRQNGTTTYGVIKDLSHDGFIKRVCPPGSEKLGTRIPPRQLVSAVNKLNQKYVALGFAPRFTMQNAQRCGVLHKLWLMEQSGFDVDDRKNAGVIDSLCGSTQYRKIKWQYKNYKKAFNL